jgi:phosphinothricin acetyltransferase
MTDVRPGGLDDLPALTALYNHWVAHTPVTFDVEPWTVEQRRRDWFENFAATGRHRLLVAVDAGQVVGYATSSRFRPKAAYDRTVETTVYLAPDATGRGTGGLLYGALLAELAGEDVHRAVAGVTLPNDASLALHRRHGFTEVGVLTEVGHKLGRWWDVQWLQRPVG